MSQRIEHEAIVLPPGWSLRPDGSAVKEVRDADGTLKAHLATEEVFMPAIVMPAPKRKHSA